MTVLELIKELEQCDPWCQVVIPAGYIDEGWITNGEQVMAASNVMTLYGTRSTRTDYGEWVLEHEEVVRVG